MTKCPNCDYDNDNIIALSVHFRKKHKSTARQLYTLLNHAGTEPTCACGCAGPVGFAGIMLGFKEFVHGHAARVRNNWGHNKAALDKSHETCRGMHERGEIKYWTQGLTKDTDPRVAALCKKGSDTIRAKPGELETRAERMRENRLNRTIPNLYGSDHPAWKGGTSALQPLCRSYLQSVWVHPKMKTSNFTCQQCSSHGGQLVVHHDIECFADILHKAIIELGVPGEDFAKRSEIAQWVADYHVKNNVSGVVLCEACHASRHK